MKKFTLTSLLLVITLAFSSCTQDDNTILQEPTAEDLLKSFNLNKSANGDYSLNYQLNQGAASDNILDEKTNTNNIYLYSSVNNQKSTTNQDLAIKEGELKVSFNDTEKGEKYSITILDDDIKTNRESIIEFVDSYGISGNGDGSYDLSFKVLEGIAVDFIYDGDRNVYEIHLSEDSSSTKREYIQTFSKENGIA